MNTCAKHSESVCRISLDVEAAGSNPFDRALLEVGMWVIGSDETFEVLFRPDPVEFDRGALKAIRRPIEEFIERGLPLVIGVNRMLDWIDSVARGRPVQLKGLNMAYDWMFLLVNVAKVRAVHTLPYKVEDIASYGMGVLGSPLESRGDGWMVRELARVAPELVVKYGLVKNEDRVHTGLDDAMRQGRLLLALEEYQKRNCSL